MSQKKIVVIGGGSGSATLLTGLKERDAQLTAVVNMADDGGSTGMLRQELGILPPGDVRQCLVALANNTALKTMFNHRFEQGSLAGHPFGNLMIAAAEATSGDYLQALALVGALLDVQGQVLPVTIDQVTICMDDGNQTLRSEFAIGHAVFARQRPDLWLEPAATVHPAVTEAITAADLVVIAPGNLYGSLAPALLVPGVADALCRSAATKVYVCNLTTKPRQTDGFTVHDYAGEVSRFLGDVPLDVVLANDPELIPDAILCAIPDNETPVLLAPHADASYQLIVTDITNHTLPTYDPHDRIAQTRSTMRHDAHKLAQVIMELL